MDDDGDCKGCGARYQSLTAHPYWCPWGRLIRILARLSV
jgi:hypothetical protein